MSAREGMQSLVDKWRKDADDAPRSQSNEDRGYSNALHDVADELAALLASPAPVFDIDAAAEAARSAFWADCASDTQYEDSHSADLGHMRAAITAAIPFLGANAACCDTPGMEAAAEAVARKMAINVRHDPDGWGMTVDGVRFKIWEVLRDRAHEMIDIVCRHLQPDMEALRRELPKGWRVIPYGGHAWTQGALCEVYDPGGSGGVVMEGDVRDLVVRKLLAALAAQAGKQGGG